MTVGVAGPAATAHALAGADAASYLVHAMAGGTGFEVRDRDLAAAFGRAVKAAGVGRIIYLGGLGRGELSAHLVSRQGVGAVLAASGVPVVELRAAVILGAGSLSYEMLRSLTERLPVMVCPRWITTRLQPLAERDLLDYLAGSLVAPPGVYAMRCAASVDPDRLKSVRDDLTEVGGDLSWYGWAWPWALRLALGRLFGEKLGILRPDRLALGASADWWEVVRLDPDQLVLVSVGWFCGDGWLALCVTDEPPRVEQVAAFRPKGLLGLAYWWSLWPVHRVVFRVRLRRRFRRVGGHTGPVAAYSRNANLESTQAT